MKDYKTCLYCGRAIGPAEQSYKVSVRRYLCADCYKKLFFTKEVSIHDSKSDLSK